MIRDIFTDEAKEIVKHCELETEKKLDPSRRLEVIDAVARQLRRTWDGVTADVLAELETETKIIADAMIRDCRLYHSAFCNSINDKSPVEVCACETQEA